MSVLTKQARIANLSRIHRHLTNLNHYMDESWLFEAYNRTRKDGAVGIDKQSSVDYSKNLEENLKDVLKRAKNGSYKAPPVRRIEILKPNGKETRPIGIPTFEDKVLQRAVVMVLEPIYETEFYNFSYGFRPKRSAHKALQYVWEQITGFEGCWILDVDIRKYFDTLDHKWLREILGYRIRDGVVVRLIHKWLKAGVWESSDKYFIPDQGTPQGGVISPMLSNIYLHEVLDKWFIEIVKPRLLGRVFLVRFADDFIIGCEHREDAARILDVLPKRFGKYGLTLHPEKTRLLDFRKPTDETLSAGDSQSFDFLGFTHFWGKSRRGRPIVKRKTAKDRYNRGLKAISDWMRKQRHERLQEQYKTLCQKLEGHYVYYGITGNSLWLSRYRREVTRLWHKWLNRRTRGKPLRWVRFEGILQFFKLPYPRIYHSYVRWISQPQLPNLVANS